MCQCQFVFTVITVASLTLSNVHAQKPATQWTKTFGESLDDEGHCVQQTGDGGYIITGSTGYNWPSDDADLWLIKTNASGNTLWTKTLGGSNEDVGKSLLQTDDGGYIIVGHTYSFGAGNADVWLIRTDGSGDTLWTKTYGGSSIDLGRSIDLTNDGGYIIAGYTSSFGSGYADVWLIKTDGSGDTLWTKTFGSSELDDGRSVRQTADGGYIITGETKSYGAGNSDVWLIKTDSSGEPVWTKTYGGSYWDEGWSVQQTADGGYIITGHFYSDDIGSQELWLIKTDASGDTLWTRVLAGGSDDEGRCVQQTADGGYIITGCKGISTGNVWLIKTSASGDTLWTQDFGGVTYENGHWVQQTADGGYIITGYTESYGAGNKDVYLIKTATDPTGINNEFQHRIMDRPVLRQNYPNPFNAFTRIGYSLKQVHLVTLGIYDILGNEILILESDVKKPGEYSVHFNGNSYPAGVYLYKLKTENSIVIKKMLLLK